MWGQIIGGIAGGLLGNKGAKDDRRFQAEQNRLNREGFEMSKPYIEGIYKSGQEELDKIKAGGAYKGDTYAGPNPYATNAYNTMGGRVPGMMNANFGMMDTTGGFAGNYQDMYNKAAGGTTLADAQKYATENSGGMVDAAMRDPRRQLEEQTLTGIDKGASGSGNTNSTRSMMAGAIANRGFNDRQADMTANINNQLMNQYTTQANQDTQNAMQANNAMSNAYGQAFGRVGDSMAYGVGAGEGLSGYDQERMNDQKRRYEEDLFFNQNANKDFSSGILSNAQYSPPTANLNNTNVGMATLGGMKAGFGYGGQAQDWWRSK
jgi:hypothetical protein